MTSETFVKNTYVYYQIHIKLTGHKEEMYMQWRIWGIPGEGGGGVFPKGHGQSPGGGSM